MFGMRMFLAALMSGVLLASGMAVAQGVGKLEEKTRAADSAQAKSWQQVDQINKEADKTTTRYQQAQQQSQQPQPSATPEVKSTAKGKAGYSVKATGVAKRGAYKKPSLKKQRELAKEK